MAVRLRQEALNRFLVRYAFQNQQAEASQTFVALAGDDVRILQLVVAQVEYDDAPLRSGLLKDAMCGRPRPLRPGGGGSALAAWR